MTKPNQKPKKPSLKVFASQKEFEKFLRDPSVEWFGPWHCSNCNAMIIYSSVESGGVTLNAPRQSHYPNHKWTLHECTPQPLSEADRMFVVGLEKLFKT
jgi:hypothetical protein